MNPRLVRQILIPAWQYLKGQNSLRVLAQLERTQWLTAEDLEDLRWRRLGALLEHARQHVPYYREIMLETGVDPAAVVRERSLARLPLLDRATINKECERLRATNISARRFVANGTGGSTGEPLRFFDDSEGVGWSVAAAWRSQRWFGVNVGERSAYLWGSNFDVSSFRSLTGRLRSRVWNMLVLPAWELGESTALVFMQQLRAFRPNLLVAYAGALYEWARLLGGQCRPIPSLTAIIVSGETLYDEWRRAIEECFRVPVYNRYGGRDIKFVAQECPARQGLHINSENLFVEILRDGRPVPPGQLGEIVITRLDNYVMPFIRYRSGDLGVLSDSLCRCDRALPLLQAVEGRVQDAIVTADGKVVSGPFFPHMMKDCPDVKAFQIHQWTPNRLGIHVVLNSTGRFTSRARIERLVREQLGTSMQVEFEIRETIPVAPSGKRRVTVSHLQRV